MVVMKSHKVLQVILIASLVVANYAKRKKSKQLNFCDPCDGKIPSNIQHATPMTTDYPNPSLKEDIVMDLYGIKDSVDQKLTTAQIISNATVPKKCPASLIKRPQKGMKIKKKNQGLYPHHVYVNLTAISTDLKAVQEHSNLLYGEMIDDECGIDYSEVHDDINKALCKMQVLNKKHSPKNKMKCKRRFKLKKFRKDFQRRNFVLCVLSDTSKMLEEMIYLLENCKASEDLKISCPSLKPRKGKTNRKKDKGEKPRKRNRKGRRKGGKRKRNRQSRKKEPTTATP